MKAIRVDVNGKTINSNGVRQLKRANKGAEVIVWPTRAAYVADQAAKEAVKVEAARAVKAEAAAKAKAEADAKIAAEAAKAAPEVAG